MVPVIKKNAFKLLTAAWEFPNIFVRSLISHIHPFNSYQILIPDEEHGAFICQCYSYSSK